MPDKFNLNKLEKVLELLKDDTITPKELEGFLNSVLKFITNAKENFEGISAKNLVQIKEALDHIKATRSEISSGILSDVNTKISSFSQSLALKMQEIDDVIAQTKALEIPTGEKGETGAPGKDGSPDSPEEIARKLETIPKNKDYKKDKRLDKSAIKGLDDKADKKDLDRAIAILDQRTQFLINKQSTGGGATGPSGADGARGSQGSQGSQGTGGGATGATGPQGTQGSQGSIGIAGADGTAGTRGPQGTQGSQGSAGNDGAAGSTGAQGATGSQGFQGTQGSIGLQGTQGSQGSASTVVGPTGPTGPQGTQGTAGSRGSQGSQGTQGSIGLQGTQGTQGSIGVQGATGPTGGTGFVSPRVTATASTLTPAPNADTTDVFILTAQAGTAAFQASSGTPVEGQKLIVKIRGTGPTNNITWTGGTGGYTAGGVALPTSMVNFKVITVGFIYDTNNSINRWMCVAVATQT